MDERAPRMIASEQHSYGVYGVAIRSNLRLALPAYSHGAFAQVECVAGSESRDAISPDRRQHHARAGADRLSADRPAMVG